MLDFQKRFRYAVPARTVTQSPVVMPTFPFLLLNSQLHCFYCLFVLPACSFSLSFPDTVQCVLLELHNTYLLSYFHILFMTFGMRLPPSFLILFSSLPDINLITGSESVFHGIQQNIEVSLRCVF